MTNHLIRLGHSRIGFILGGGDLSVSEQRLAGYKQALREAGLPVEPGLIARGDFTYRSGLAAADRLLRLDPRPSAIFASNDDMAAAVLSVAHRKQLDVPRDLSVCGYDDTAIATNVWPELTTIRQPITEMAREGTDLLAAAVRARHAGSILPPQHRQLDYTLVERGSTSSRASGD
jgi:LacI family transcriptional regulator